ncbi:malonic semialdehyde reductase [Pseudomonas sp. LS1212]|uniref:malonic semialdehyde reductase n=1 Tax=Pseudomonas sp. LS1212 TaxID=2972478 RepID=UPI00215C587C|nr:malonic semialdehyde reductase [Pseudomonas sp. LS1212]UVJ46231.1 malonic semialdehyde reductase [Pseudomonas sp. LS1212]
MNEPVNDHCLDLLFRKARSQNGWLDKPVRDETLKTLYDLVRWGPTSANSCPARIVFLRTPQAKQRLLPALSAGNVEKTLSAPVTAVIGYDMAFYDQLPKLFPHHPGVREWVLEQPELIEATALRNSSMQGAYFILAARALGLDCGPMSGFEHARVDNEFFPQQRSLRDCFADMQIKSNFICNLGYGDPSKVFARSPRLDFDEACVLL